MTAGDCPQCPHGRGFKCPQCWPATNASRPGNDPGPAMARPLTPLDGPEAVIMRLAGFAAGGATPFDGQWLESFDHEAFDGAGDCYTTADRSRAMRFESMSRAVEFMRRVPACRPLRADGQPNRPMTATNWALERATEPGR